MKGYSPVRRWLRQERAREHLGAIAADEATVQGWKPSRAPAVEFASRVWRVPLTTVLASYQDDTSTDETIYIGHGRIE